MFQGNNHIFGVGRWFCFHWPCSRCSRWKFAMSSFCPWSSHGGKGFTHSLPKWTRPPCYFETVLQLKSVETFLECGSHEMLAKITNSFNMASKRFGVRRRCWCRRRGVVRCHAEQTTATLARSQRMNALKRTVCWASALGTKHELIVEARDRTNENERGNSLRSWLQEERVMGGEHGPVVAFKASRNCSLFFHSYSAYASNEKC